MVNSEFINYLQFTILLLFHTPKDRELSPNKVWKLPYLMADMLPFEPTGSVGWVMFTVMLSD